MRVTSKGQVTIPREIRRRLGIDTATEVEFVVDGNNVVLRRVDADGSRGNKVVESLRGRATVRMTTDEIMALTRGEE